MYPDGYCSIDLLTLVAFDLGFVHGLIGTEIKLISAPILTFLRMRRALTIRKNVILKQLIRWSENQGRQSSGTERCFARGALEQYQTSGWRCRKRC